MTNYKCIKDVMMVYDGSIVFTKGKIYTAKDDGDGGYVFKDNHHDPHYVSIEFLEDYFEGIEYIGLDFKVL